MTKRLPAVVSLILLALSACGADGSDLADSQYAGALKTLAKMDKTFAKEARDDEWASRLERKLNEAFVRGAYPGTQLLSALCKSASCRAEADHDDSNSSLQFERFGYTLGDERMDYYIQHVCDDDACEMRRTVAYFFKQKH